MNGTCATCAKHDTCFYSSEKVIDCTRHKPKPETNYEKLFGTPERAAQTMALQCFGSDGSMCHYCPFDDCDEKLRNSGAYPTVYDALLEWLRGEDS